MTKKRKTRHALLDKFFRAVGSRWVNSNDVAKLAGLTKGELARTVLELKRAGLAESFSCVLNGKSATFYRLTEANQ